MDFSFTPEQEDLRREARMFLEATPAPSPEQLEQERSAVERIMLDGLVMDSRRTAE